MRVFSAEEKKDILQRAFQKQMLTGKPHAKAALHVMSEKRQQKFVNSLESDEGAVMNIIAIMDATAQEASDGEILTWSNLERELVKTSSAFLRLFNIKALLNGDDQLWDHGAPEKKTPYLKMLEERCDLDY